MLLDFTNADFRLIIDNVLRIKDMTEQKIKDNFPKVIPLDIAGAELRYLEPTFENSKMIFDIIIVNREHLLPWMEWATDEKTKTAEDSFRFLNSGKTEREAGNKFDFGVFFNDVYSGNIGVFDVSEKKKSCEIGYWLVKDAVGKGLISSAVRALEKEMFQRGINRIQIKCDKGNDASANVARRCGYVLEGEIREDFFAKLQNKFRTTMLFSKLKSEYKA